MMPALRLAIANSPIAVLERQRRVNLIHHTALFSVLMQYPRLCAAAWIVLDAVRGGPESRDEALKMTIVRV